MAPLLALQRASGRRLGASGCMIDHSRHTAPSRPHPVRGWGPRTTRSVRFLCAAAAAAASAAAAPAPAQAGVPLPTGGAAARAALTQEGPHQLLQLQLQHLHLEHPPRLCELRGADGLRVSLLTATGGPDAGSSPMPRPRPEAAPLLREERFETIYRIGEVLGAGTYGTVRVCTHRETGKQYAVKILQRRRNKTDRTQAIYNEAAMAHRVRWCRSVVRPRAVHTDSYSVYLVMDLVPGGSLQALLDARGGRLPEAEAAAALRGVLDALAACHAEGVCYGDVKPANFMLAEPYEPSDPAAADIDVRMVDFGCARACPGDCSLEGLSGTPAYMAPEVAAGQPYGPACDLWGVGVMLYQLLTGRFPYWNCGLDELAQMPTRKVLMDVSTGAVMQDTPACRALSPEARALLAALLERDPRRRASAHDALRHPWMAAHGRAPVAPAAA